MKHTPTDRPTLLAFGAHPDDLEFGCGGVIARETQGGRPAHLVVCSLGESATHGSPAQRQKDAEKSAAILGATIEFIDLGGDAHFQVSASNVLRLASLIRRACPGVVLAPSPVENQHPDHARLGHMIRDAARLARYGGVQELRAAPPHAIDQLFFYALTREAEPRDISPLLLDVSSAETMAAWRSAMEAHESQVAAREYVELELTRARLRGLSAGVGYAIALFPNDPLVVESLSQVTRCARRF